MGQPLRKYFGSKLRIMSPRGLALKARCEAERKRQRALRDTHKPT